MMPLRRKKILLGPLPGPLNTENYMRQAIVETMLVAACAIGIAVGGIYIYKNVSCFDFFGLAKGCVIGKNV